MKTVLFDAYLKYDRESDKVFYMAKNSRKGSKVQKSHVADYKILEAKKSAIMAVIEELGLFDELLDYKPKK